MVSDFKLSLVAISVFFSRIHRFFVWINIFSNFATFKPSQNFNKESGLEHYGFEHAFAFTFILTPFSEFLLYRVSQ